MKNKAIEGKFKMSQDKECYTKTTKDFYSTRIGNVNQNSDKVNELTKELEK